MLIFRSGQTARLRRHVREIRYDNMEYESQSIEKKDYLNIFGSGCELKAAQFSRPNDDPDGSIRCKTWTNAAVKRGYQAYEEHRVTRPALKEFYNHLLHTQYGRPGNSKVEFRTALENRDVSILEKYLPPDMMCLIKALMLLPKVDALSLCGERYFEKEDYWTEVDVPYSDSGVLRRTFRIDNENKRGRDCVVLNPSPKEVTERRGWNLRGSGDGQRGFAIFTYAAAISGIKNLRHLNVHSHESPQATFACVSWSLFLPRHALPLLRSSFQNVINIDIRMDRFPSYGLRPQGVLTLLRAAVDLQTLTLGFNKFTWIDDFTRVLGDHWPRLRRLTLRNMSVHASQFVAFCLLHHPSLRSLTLGSVLFDGGDEPAYSTAWSTEWSNWPVRVPEGRDLTANMSCALEGIKGLDLEEFCITSDGYDERLEHPSYSWHSKDAASIRAFLENGGT